MTSTTASETTPLMRKFLNIEKGHHNKPFWYKAFKFACDNYKITIIGSMILHALMSLMIGFLMYSPANQPPLNPDYPRFSKTEFLIFLFVNLAAALPIILEYILDYRARDCFAYVVFRGNLIVTFTLPVVAKMLFMQYYDLNDDSTYMQFLCIFAQTDSSKAYFLLVTLLSLMFRAHVIAMDKDYSELKMRLSYGVVVIAFMAVTSKFLFMLSLITPFEMMFFSSSIALMYGELFLAAYLVGNILIYNFYNYQESRFNTHNQLNDVMKSSALFAYLSLYGITGIMVYGFGYNNYTFIIRVSLYMYLTLAYLVSVIPSVCTKKKMAIDEEKLKIRLNLIRYVSHEMRTPLNTAKLGVDMAMDDLTQLSAHGASGKNSKSKANPEDAVTDSQGNGVAQVQETLSLVSEACTVASVTLDDLLTFDKLDEQKLTIDVEDISPWKLLLDVAAPFHINAQEKRIVLTIDSVGDPNWHQKVSTSVDKFKMGQVIRNMISNAVKFTPPGGCVAVKLEKDEDNEMVKISVKDTGPGISAANQKKLFGQYVQFNAAQLQQGKGSGLGLWISKSIVELHGGRIYATSEGEGFGCTFCVDIPYIDNKDLSPPSPNSELSRSPGSMSPTKAAMKRGSAGLQVKYNVNDAAAAQTTAPSLVSVSTKGPKVSPSVSSAGSNPETKKPKGSFLANDVVVRRKSASNRPTQMSPVIRRYSALSDNGSHAGPASVVESDVYTTATNHSGSQAEIDMASHFSASVASPKLPILPENEIADKKVWARSLKFLVVDDSAPSRTIVSRTLQKLGHTTEQAENGMAFLQKMKNLPEAADAQTIEVAVKLQSLAIPAYDVVLIDDHMPFMNGPEAIDAYYKQGNAKCIIVGVTGSTDEVTEAKFMNSGATAVLGKPLDIAKLKLIVEAELMKYSACIY